MGYLLDTNIVTAIVKNNEPVKKKYRQLDSLGQDVSISCITYYEVKRGLLAVNATRKLSIFNRFCQEVTVLFLDDMEIVERASAIHAALKRRGTPIGDADILIAATAIARDLTLVSHDSDMQRVPGLKLEDWLSTEE
ncbi:MAG: type II toxin-antitoxin system VapC family toxin [Hormoscilla sp.]